MTYVLRYDEGTSRWEEFDSEKKAMEWAKANISRRDIRNWTLIDPDGEPWELYF